MAEPGPLCIYEKRDPHIAIIRLNRPEKKNAISRDLYWALDECWQKAKADDDVWSIILTGTADAFCVGGDLKENIAFAKGEMTGPRSGPARLLQPAPAADAQADHRRDQRLRGRRRLQPGAVLPYPLLRAGIEVRLLRSALVAYGGVAELHLPAADRLGLLVCPQRPDDRCRHRVSSRAGAERSASRTSSSTTASN